MMHVRAKSEAEVEERHFLIYGINIANRKEQENLAR